MDEKGNIEEKTKACIPATLSDSKSSITAKETNSKKSSGVEWEDDNYDVTLLEASEDVELAEAADWFLPQRNWTVDEIPDELLVDALRQHEVQECQEQINVPV